MSALEQRVMSLGTGGAMCGASSADRPTSGNFRSSSEREAVDAQIEVLTHAFSCDQVRTAFFQVLPENAWNNGSFVPGWNELGGTGIHSVSHFQNQDPSEDRRNRAVDQMTLLNAWAADAVSRLLGRLDEVGVLDETLVVWIPAMSHGGYHCNRNTPVVVIQGSQGPRSAGRYLRWGNYSHNAAGGSRANDYGGGETNNNLLISICHAMGLNDVTSFGKASLCRATGLDDRLI